MVKKQSIKRCVIFVAGFTALAACAAEREERPSIPQEAFDACASSSEGDSCSMSGRNGETMSGQCMAPPSGQDEDTSSEELACRPDNMGEPPGRRPPQGQF